LPFASLANSMGKTLFMESRPLFGVCLDIDDFNQGVSIEQLWWLLESGTEYNCAVVAGNLYTEQLLQHFSTPRARPPINHVTCVVTGGTKGLGMLHCLQCQRSGCKALVLTSRTGHVQFTDLLALSLGMWLTACLVKVCMSTQHQHDVELVQGNLPLSCCNMMPLILMRGTALPCGLQVTFLL
jgi:hypothetical protein